MAVSSPTDFQPAEGFYVPEGSGVLFSLTPTVIVLILLLVLIAAVAGWMAGRRARPVEDPSDRIYDAVRKAAASAAGAPRDSVMSSARHLKTVVDSHLGSVMALGGGLSAPCKALDKALEGLEDAPHKPVPKDDKPEPGAIEKLVINARRVVFNAPASGHGEDPAHGDGPHADTAHDHGHHDGHGHDDHGHGHGHGKPMDARSQLAAVRAAVHAFSDHWSDKPARLAELRGARRQLTVAPGKSPLSKS